MSVAHLSDVDAWRASAQRPTIAHMRTRQRRIHFTFLSLSHDSQLTNFPEVHHMTLIHLMQVATRSQLINTYLARLLFCALCVPQSAWGLTLVLAAFRLNPSCNLAQAEPHQACHTASIDDACTLAGLTRRAS